jgi:hypothetical protein
LLIDHELAVPGQIRGGFPGAGGGEDIGAMGAAGLGVAQGGALARLADGGVRGGQVHHHGGARQRAIQAGRDRRPEILADLCVYGRGPARRGASKSRSVPNGAVCPATVIVCRSAPRGVREPALFVEFAIIGQIALRDHAQKLAVLNGEGAVEQLAAHAQGAAEKDQRAQAGAGLDHIARRGVDGVQQGGLMVQIVDGVPGQRQFGKHRARRRGSWACATCMRSRSRRVRGGIGEMHRRGEGRDPGEAMAVKIRERGHEAFTDQGAGPAYAQAEYLSAPGRSSTQAALMSTAPVTSSTCLVKSAPSLAPVKQASVNTGLAGIRAMHAGKGQVRAAGVQVTQIGAGQVGIAQAGLGDGGCEQTVIGQDERAQLRFAQVGIVQLGAFQVGAAQVCAAQAVIRKSAPASFAPCSSTPSMSRP